ncbi:cell division protein ZipA C-terminal FtsZ-binding domain-containing protein [Halomonas sp. hl-4]|uniref:cell division protein ZipA C-terminal FtsZ-binding domain-containing protein n=1 Tax=Halomonas sp. hl-4 TaxID=1761789 RepID=UPI000BB6AF1B|nr:cell division protein ZipA C-terminal FtsZ-binding domain-containing protein [Halomonas sp. hl-4]SNY97109.1 cell division protein ZipA [Halomonas sp. hl-4]
MELREWLIILGLALVSLIVIDGVRRLQRQRRVPRLDQAVGETPSSPSTEFSDAAKEAEINWELPNGGARVVKPADYSGLSQKPKLERQEHPGPSKILSQFKRSTHKASSPVASKVEEGRDEHPVTTRTAKAATATRAQRPEVKMPEPTSEPEKHHREPAVSSSDEVTPVADDAVTAAAHEPRMSAMDESDTERTATAQMSHDDTPVLRAEPEDAAFAKHASSDSQPKRRQLRSDIAGEYHDDDDEEAYRLVDFEEIGRSLKQRMIAHRKARALKKAEKARRAEALAKQKAERKALEAEQRREAEEAAEAEKARIAQEQAQARELEAQAAEEERLARAAEMAQYAAEEDAYYAAAESHEPDAPEGVVRTHPALEKALRHDVCGEHAKETLTNADEVVVISVLSRDPAGFDGGKLLELMMACGLRYSSAMGVFHRFETESADSELQFSMVNVVKPGVFPIEEMDEFVTPGITLLMPLPGAHDSSAAFEAMVETAMVVVRHMGGELKDENHSVMTAQTIEFARQRVHEFERRHRLHRHMQAH